ncbi:MAG: DUF3147 family protein [Alloacidobacterium sp.]
MIEAKLSSLKDIKPHEYAARFLFGGLCTAGAGLIAMHFGPAIGGLFLAFPAIFPAGASLLEAHEKRKKRKAGYDGTNRGRTVASLDAAGASIGSIGLIGFALTLCLTLTSHNAYVVIAFGTLIWFAVSIALWFLRKHKPFRNVGAH